MRAALLLAVAPSVCLAAPNSTAKSASQPDRFFGLRIANPNAAQHLEYRYGVPFLMTSSPSREIKVDAPVKKLFLLGLTETMRPSAWSNPLDMSRRFFIGDNLGAIRLTYTDGSTQNFPLILGESVWFGMPFYQAREPFPTDAHFRNALQSAFHLIPRLPLKTAITSP